MNPRGGARIRDGKGVVTKGVFSLEEFLESLKPKFRMARVWFGYGSHTEWFEYLRFSVPMVPLEQGFPVHFSTV